MQERTIDRLVSIAESIDDSILMADVGEESLIKSQLVLSKLYDFFEYAAEIVKLASNNEKYTKTNAILFRVLLEILVKIKLIRTHVSKCDDAIGQEKIIKAFRARFLRERMQHYKRRKESVEGMKESQNKDQILAFIEKWKTTLEKEEKKIKRQLAECKGEVGDDALWKLVVEGNFYKQSISLLEVNNFIQYPLSVFYQDCSQHIHPNHTLPADEKEKSKDLSKIEECFAIIVLELNAICSGQIMIGVWNFLFLLEVVWKFDHQKTKG